MNEEVLRFDAGKLGAVERTPQGGIRVMANLTRVGVFAYKRADGTTVNELRPPEEVFAVDSLATLRGAPVTDMHPKQPVHSKNWREVTIGHVGDDVKQDGDYVAAPVTVQDGVSVERVDKRDRSEVSCGYACRIDSTPGEWRGQRYDQVQRGIRYNHVAIGPKGWGRAGRDVAMRLDGAGHQIDEESLADSPLQANKETMATKYRLDGVDYDVSTPEFLQALAKNEQERSDELKIVIAERDLLKGQRDEFKKRLDSAEDPKRFADAVKSRVALERDAIGVLGSEYKTDGKSDRDLMVDVVRHDDKDFDAKDRTDEYVRGRFESSARVVRRADDGGNGLRAAREEIDRVNRGDDKSQRQDGEAPKKGAAAARQRMVEENQKAAGQPLRFTRES